MSQPTSYDPKSAKMSNKQFFIFFLFAQMLFGPWHFPNRSKISPFWDLAAQKLTTKFGTFWLNFFWVRIGKRCANIGWDLSQNFFGRIYTNI
jgi:hypothetical protein